MSSSEQIQYGRYTDCTERDKNASEGDDQQVLTGTYTTVRVIGFQIELS